VKKTEKKERKRKSEREREEKKDRRENEDVEMKGMGRQGCLYGLTIVCMWVHGPSMHPHTLTPLMRFQLEFFF